MQKLLSEFFYQPQNKWQTEFLEHEAELLMHQHGYSFNQSKMRGALLGWVSSIVEQYAIQIDTLDGKIQIHLADKSMSIEWSEADKLLDVIEAVKTEEGMIKLWEMMK
ncbi:hypothetical protein PP410_gp37 [Vibrio phage NF]|uniref:Uncharacterized protein n=1 Tax=Vibrio phage NF TaxID=2686202 RepID=A0A6B9J553_9CAUD|nr:hypothetical protein PP410_gp37 [Vibrio phage NF]QGZ13254.1 hypothetical protein [Vibrio phage NF]